ncbi:L-fucose:H+ symporter permease [Pedobacter riviphilus]|uniref:L-fucose:H+ symporter permease n=2 Tax=Sphingobacteriaceae TaxID=84566 RepID=A0ABX6TJJ5_9SPHI|nr:L-fucose:H+ symporter permease [Pedobacter sp. SG908]QNR85643.1 L-fucose:H+ symporter permease [Pedobacter riviphilus]
MMETKRSTLAVILITSLFFLWGFAHNLDPILIPHLKRSFTLTTVQATLVDSAVFIAYFIMALPAGIIMKKYGYKSGIIIGLLIFSVGCYLFLPAAQVQSYNFFLAALFIIACGLTILETAANPYITLVGKPETSTFRLNLAQSFNGLAASLAPIIGGKLILVEGVSDGALAKMDLAARKSVLASEAASVQGPYFVLGSILVILAVIFYFIKLPDIRTNNEGRTKRSFWGVFKHKQLSWAIAAQFFYVGAQVSVFSLFILYATKSAGITEKEATYYLGVCGFAFLIGRFFTTFLMRFFKAHHLLVTYAFISILLCFVAIMASGITTVYAVIGICFFMSVMFPTIFSLGIKDLKEDTELGSSLIIMSIVGGAILPRFFGYLSDGTGNIQNGYYIPLACFAVIMLFGLKGQKITRNDIINQPNEIL